MSVRAIFDQENEILIILPDNADMTTEITSGVIARAKKIVNLREGESE